MQRWLDSEYAYGQSPSFLPTRHRELNRSRRCIIRASSPESPLLITHSSGYPILVRISGPRSNATLALQIIVLSDEKCRRRFDAGGGRTVDQPQAVVPLGFPRMYMDKLRCAWTRSFVRFAGTLVGGSTCSEAVHGSLGVYRTL